MAASTAAPEFTDQISTYRLSIITLSKKLEELHRMGSGAESGSYRPVATGVSLRTFLL